MSTHKPVTQATIDPVLVAAHLKHAGTTAVSVTFSKVNGDIVKKNGFLKAHSRRVGSDRGITQGEQMKARGQVWIDYPETGKGASFFLDRVHQIKERGNTHVPE